MARGERGVFRMIFQNFVNSMRPHAKKRTFVGEDYHGTKYYEAEPTGPSKKRQPIRSFEPVNKDAFDQDLPAEWEAWLRFRRKDPPTKEEIEASFQLALQKKENARLLEEKFSGSKSTQLEVPTEKQGEVSYPKYEEYENFGRDYKQKT